MRISKNQSVCDWVGVSPVRPEAGSKLGLALSTIGLRPIHGLRHRPTETTNGWYIWCGEGELQQHPEFFAPLHVEHVGNYLPDIREYIDLPPGYRFLIDGNDFEDVWFDENLLKID